VLDLVLQAEGVPAGGAAAYEACVCAAGTMAANAAAAAAAAANAGGGPAGGRRLGSKRRLPELRALGSELPSSECAERAAARRPRTLVRSPRGPGDLASAKRHRPWQNPVGEPKFEIRISSNHLKGHMEGRGAQTLYELDPVLAASLPSSPSRP
jgi:hypothetical protein